MSISIEDLRELCLLTVELTRLRQNECKHLCIEEFAPVLLGNLIRQRLAIKPRVYADDSVNWWHQPISAQRAGE